MEHEQQHEQDDDVYGGDLPDEDYMESEFDPSADADADADAEAAAESKSQVILVGMYARSYLPMGFM